jgi:hypothetical protein
MKDLSRFENTSADIEAKCAHAYVTWILYKFVVINASASTRCPSPRQTFCTNTSEPRTRPVSGGVGIMVNNTCASAQEFNTHGIIVIQPVSRFRERAAIVSASR